MTRTIFKSTAAASVCCTCGKSVAVGARYCPHCDQFRPVRYAAPLGRFVGQLALAVVILPVAGMAYSSVPPFALSDIPWQALLGAAIILGLYFFPSIEAYNRKHHNRAAIFVLNLLLGWTILGWVIALVWAFTAVRTPEAAS